MKFPALIIGLAVLHSSAAVGAPKPIPLDDVSRAGLVRSAVTGEAHGKTLSCEGVALVDLLRKAGIVPAGKLPGAMLDSYLVVSARDEYRVTYSLARRPAAAALGAPGRIDHGV